MRAMHCIPLCATLCLGTTTCAHRCCRLPPPPAAAKAAQPSPAAGPGQSPAVAGLPLTGQAVAAHMAAMVAQMRPGGVGEHCLLLFRQDGHWL